jgi:hypothetical protein
MQTGYGKPRSRLGKVLPVHGSSGPLFTGPGRGIAGHEENSARAHNDRGARRLFFTRQRFLSRRLILVFAVIRSGIARA